MKAKNEEPARPKVSVVIPCLNEEEGVRFLLPQLNKVADEIIIVDDGSTDNTAAVAGSLGATVIYDGRKSYGLGFQRGLSAARGDIIATMDGDGTYPPLFIPIVIDYMNENGLDFVNCARFPLDNPQVMPRQKYIGNRLTTAVTNRLFGCRIIDSLSGMWVFRRAVVGKILPSSAGMEFSLSIKLHAIKHDSVQFGEYHISYGERIDGPSKFRPARDSLRISLAILRLWVSFIADRVV